MTGAAAWPDDAAGRAVAAAWAMAFESAEPARDDDFFACGGHSLLAMRLVAALRAHTGHAITAEEIFQARTPGQLAARLARPPEAEGLPRDSPAVLSPMQQRMWFVEQLAPGTAAHHVSFAVRLRGQLDVAALGAALTAVAERHEVLRWRIRPGAIPEVAIDPPAAVPLPVASVPDGRPATLAALLSSAAAPPFDLVRGPLWRAGLFRLSDRDHVLSVVAHHIIFDGWSQDVLSRDLSAAYRRITVGRPAGLGRLPVTFADYVALTARRQSAAGRPNLHWWTEHLAGVPSVLDLPGDRPRPPVQSFRGASAAASVPPAVIRRMDELSARLGATRNAGLLAAFGILLRRLSGQPDLVVGVPFADRGHAGTEPLVGLLLQILPLRLRGRDDDGFAGHVRRSQAEMNEALAHADAPWERIMEAAGGPRDLSRNPLIQVMFNALGFAGPRLNLPGTTQEALPVPPPGSLFDLTLQVSEAGDRLILRAVYNRDLYAARRIRALLASFVQLLADLTADPARPVRQAAMRPRRSRLPHWRDPLPSWDGPGLVEQVLQVAARQPDRPAVSAAGLRLSYRDLVAIAGQAALAVAGSGVQPGDAVAVLAARHPALPAMLLGIAQAGARWAIMDTAHPEAFLAAQAAAVQPRAAVSFSPGPGRAIWPAGVPVIDADAVTQRALSGPASPAGTRPCRPAARGYLSFTSGTTGPPRLVVTGERPLSHFLAWYADRFALGAEDRFAMLSGLAHDPLLRDLFTPLVLGAQVCVPEPGLRRDPAGLAGWLRAAEVTVAHLTPQLARLLITVAAASGIAWPRMRLIGLAGDQATTADVQGLRRLAPAARVVNFYGTTETPQAQACLEPKPGPGGMPRPGELESPDDQVPVGIGIDGAQLLVLDAAGRPAAVGELGDVLIRSRYLADGYSDPELTRERFAHVPAGDDADRCFRTGDRGRYLPDGGVMLAGRADSQVKVRGFRVETVEVSAAVRSHPGISAAHVIAVGRPGQQALRAYAVPAEPGLDAEQVRRHLRARLPEHAVPAEVVMLPALPLTLNGKVDTAALPEPPRRWRAEPGQAELSGRTEQVIAAAWREVLGRPRLGATDNFFDSGGDSLAIVALQVRLQQLLGTPVAVTDLFRYPTIRSLADLLDGGRPDSFLGRAARRAAQRRQRAPRPASKPPVRTGTPIEEDRHG